MASAVTLAPRIQTPRTKLARALLNDFVCRRLSREERLVVMLHYGEDLTFQEIAGILDLAPDSVEAMHARIVARVRNQFVPAVERVLVA